MKCLSLAGSRSGDVGANGSPKKIREKEEGVPERSQERRTFPCPTVCHGAYFSPSFSPILTRSRTSGKLARSTPRKRWWLGEHAIDTRRSVYSREYKSSVSKDAGRMVSGILWSSEQVIVVHLVFLF